MPTTADAGASPDIVRGPGYKAYVLIVILLANVLNYADRSILSVLAEPIKRDLHVSDAQLGFLYGTSFVLLNGLATLMVARVADNWLRNRLLALGLVCWSGMTALSGFANSLGQLAGARLGVGLGEATLSPIGHSLIADLFSARARSRAFSVYLLGSFIGSAVCISVAGALIGWWPSHCSTLGACGLRPWQAAFLAFGLPGLIVAGLTLAIGEPAGDIARRRLTRPLRMGAAELSLLVPPFSLFRLAAQGGKPMVQRNLLAAAAIALVTGLLIRVTGDILQWSAIAIAAYCAMSWGQGLHCRDPDVYHRTLGSRSFVLIVLGVTPQALITASVSFWAIPLAVRTFRLAPHQATGLFGLALGGGALVGTLVGGVVGDWLRQRTPLASLWVALACIVVQVFGFAWMLHAPNVIAYAGGLAVMSAAGAWWAAPIAALIQEMLLPTMRARGATIFALTIQILSLAFGPYTVGRIADASGSLAIGLTTPFLLAPIGMMLLVMAMRTVPSALQHERFADVAIDVRTAKGPKDC